MLLFSAEQEISFLSRLGPPEVISFKNWAAFKHQWPLKIKGQQVNSTQPGSQTFSLLEMKGIFKKTSCTWSCLHFCPTSCQRLSEHADHKTKMCCPTLSGSCSSALYAMWDLPGTQRCPGDLSSPHSSGTAAPWEHSLGGIQGTTTQGHPVASCCRSNLRRVLVWRGGGLGLVCCCPTLSSSGCPRELIGASHAAGHWLGAKPLASFLLLQHPEPGPWGGQWQN